MCPELIDPERRGAEMEASCAVWIFALITVCSGQEANVTEQCYLGCPGSRGATAGTEFFVAFTPNNDTNNPPKRYVQVTGQAATTAVNVTVKNVDFNTSFTVRRGETFTVPYPNGKAINGSVISPGPMRIQSSERVTVVSRSDSGETATIYPYLQWGKQFLAFGPNSTDRTNYALVVTGQSPATVDISPTGPPSLNPGLLRSIDIQSNSIIQFQIQDEFFATRLVANSPVAIITLSQCERANQNCGEIYEQLQPSACFGNAYVLPEELLTPDILSRSAPLPDASATSILYAVSPKNTTITYTTANGKFDRSVTAGEILEIDVRDSPVLTVSSTDGFELLYFGNGGKATLLESFFMTIPSTDDYCLSYDLIGQENFSNFGIIIAKTIILLGILIDGLPLRVLQWKIIKGTEYSYAVMKTGKSASIHRVHHLISPFALLSVGYSTTSSYGSMAPCSKGKGILGLPGQCPSPNSTTSST